MKSIHRAISETRVVLRQPMTHADAALIAFRMHSNFSRFTFSAAVLCLCLLAGRSPAQTPCPGSESCTGLVAQMVCPAPGTTLPGNEVTFTWCNANADYFLQIESLRGVHDIFFAFVPAQNYVRLINLPTNGATIYVTLWTKIHGELQTPLDYTYAAANFNPPRLRAAMFGTNGQFQFTISGVTPGKTNVVQSSVNLLDWTSIATNVAVSNSMQIIDSTAPNSNERFYRTFEMR